MGPEVAASFYSINYQKLCSIVRGGIKYDKRSPRIICARSRIRATRVIVRSESVGSAQIPKTTPARYANDLTSRVGDGITLPPRFRDRRPLIAPAVEIGRYRGGPDSIRAATRPDRARCRIFAKLGTPTRRLQILASGAPFRTLHAHRWKS